jgi:hypothetical protein
VKGAKQINLCPSQESRSVIIHRVRIQKDERRCIVVQYGLAFVLVGIIAHHFFLDFRKMDVSK